MRALTLVIAVLVSPASLTSLSRAESVPAGYDLFFSVLWSTELDIPANFFDAGSDAMTLPLTLIAGPPVSFEPMCPFNTAVNTIIWRKAMSNLPNVGDVGVVPIELVALNLASANPIVVTYDGGRYSERWDVQMSTSPTVPSTGMMTMNHWAPWGGTFSAQVSLYARYTFVRQADPGIRVYDAGVFSSPNELSVVSDWAHDAAPGMCITCGASNFYPSVSPGPKRAPLHFTGSSGNLTTLLLCLETVATRPTTWGAAKVLYRD